MPAYQYAALDEKGRTCKGLLEGDSPRQIRQLLRERELIPLSVEHVATNQRRSTAQDTTSPYNRWYKRSRIKTAELTLITRQLATLISAGLPVEQALSTVAQQSSKPRLQGLLLALRSKVLEGHSLAAAVDDYPHAFPDIYRATIAAGEQSGHLEIVLERLADYSEQRQQTQQKVMLALLYPLLLTTVAILICIGLLAYVVPQVVQVFASMQQQLPWLTRSLIALSDFLQNHGNLLALMLLLLIATGVYTLRQPRLRQRIQGLAMHVPILGRLLRGLDGARFTRTLSILLASGVPVVEALNVSAQVINNLALRDAVLEGAIKVREGSSLYQALANNNYGFSALTLQLIASGEASGRLETLLERAAQQQERETETLTTAFLAILEPLLILLMGIIVLTIVLAILLPIFDLNQMIS